MEPIDFSDLEPKQRLVIGPDKVKYLLVSASVDATLKFRNASTRAGKFETSVNPATGKEEFKVVGFNDITEQELVLVANTLAKTVENQGEHVLCDSAGNPVYVPLARLKAWPGAVISKLYKASLDLSPWLRQGDDDAGPKGSSVDTADSSNSPTPPAASSGS